MTCKVFPSQNPNFHGLFSKYFQLQTWKVLTFKSKMQRVITQRSSINHAVIYLFFLRQTPNVCHVFS